MRNLLICGVALVLAGCATTWDIDRYEAPEADFAARQTYAWKPGQFSTPVARNAAEVAAVERAVQHAVDDGLAAKGYSKVASDRADMIVTYQIAGHRRFVFAEEERIGAPSPNEVLMPSGSAQLPPTSPVAREQTVGEGSMIVFIEDPASGRLIWRGVITAETRVSSPEAGARLAADMARHIVNTLPAR